MGTEGGPLGLEGGPGAGDPAGGQDPLWDGGVGVRLGLAGQGPRGQGLRGPEPGDGVGWQGPAGLVTGRDGDSCLWMTVLPSLQSG